MATIGTCSVPSLGVRRCLAAEGQCLKVRGPAAHAGAPPFLAKSRICMGLLIMFALQVLHGQGSPQGAGSCEHFAWYKHSMYYVGEGSWHPEPTGAYAMPMVDRLGRGPLP